MLDDIGADGTRGVDSHCAGAGDVEELGAGARAVEWTIEQGRQSDMASGHGNEVLIGWPGHGVYDRGARQATIEPIDLGGSDDLEGQTRLSLEHGLDHGMEPADLGSMRGAAVVENADALAGVRCWQRGRINQPRRPIGIFIAQIGCGDPEFSALRPQPIAAPGSQTRELESIAPAHAARGSRIEEIVIHEKNEFGKSRTMALDKPSPGGRNVAHQDDTGACQFTWIGEWLAKGITLNRPPAGLQDRAHEIIGRWIRALLDQMDRS